MEKTGWKSLGGRKWDRCSPHLHSRVALYCCVGCALCYLWSAQPAHHMCWPCLLGMHSSDGPWPPCREDKVCWVAGFVLLIRVVFGGPDNSLGLWWNFLASLSSSTYRHVSKSMSNKYLKTPNYEHTQLSSACDPLCGCISSTVLSAPLLSSHSIL